MASIPPTPDEPSVNRSLHTDTLADSVLILLAIFAL